MIYQDVFLSVYFQHFLVIYLNNVFYFHNEKDNKIFCQFFDNGKSKDTVESTFKLIFPKPINPETQITRFWHGKEKLLGYSENKAKDIHYLKY